MDYLDDLPKEPLEAVKYILITAMKDITPSKVSLADLKNRNHSLYDKLFIYISIARNSVHRLKDADLREQLIRKLHIEEDDTLRTVNENFELAFSAIVARELDDHFIDPESIEMFDKAELDQTEKNDIRELMSNVRRLVDNSDVLFEQQKRNVLFHVAKIEDELHKTKSRFRTFLAAAYEVSALAKRVGEDAQPIADAVEKARTITERKVEGQRQIAEAEKPKQLTGPQNE